MDFIANATNQALKIEDDFVTFDLNGRTYITTQSGNEIGNVAGRSGRLTLTDGIWGLNSASEVRIGSVAGASGALNITTGGDFRSSTLGQTIRLIVGHLGSGTLTVDNGGRVTGEFGVVGGGGASATGTATITGAASQWVNSSFLAVGNLGQGTLNITLGGRVENTRGTIGGIDGLVNVSGTNSRWVNSDVLQVGIGRGTLAFVPEPAAAISTLIFLVLPRRRR